MYERTPENLKPGIQICNGHNICFENDSSIIFNTYNVNAYRGLAVSILLCDEFAFTSDKTANEFLDIVPYCLNLNGSMIIISTRVCRSKKNPFWKIWTQATSNKPHNHCLFKPFTIRSKDVSQQLKRNILFRKQVLPAKEYDNEYIIRMK